MELFGLWLNRSQGKIAVTFYSFGEKKALKAVDVESRNAGLRAAGLNESEDCDRASTVHLES